MKGESSFADSRIFSKSLMSNEQSSIESNLYFYRAKIVGVYDGDTVTANIDLGLKTWKNGEKLRLARINAPEMRPKKHKKIDGKKARVDERSRVAEKTAARASRDLLRQLILGKDVLIKTSLDKADKYGRYIAEIHFGDENINDLVVKRGHAVYKEY